jgi:hypothetical protein
MANTFKVLARGQAPSYSASTVYTVPSGTTTLVNNILVANNSACPASYSINLAGVIAGASVSVPGRDTAVLDIKQVLSAGNTITLFTSSSPSVLSVHISGLEIT